MRFWEGSHCVAVRLTKYTFRINMFLQKPMNLKRQKQPPHNTVSNTPTKIWQTFHYVPVSPRTLMSMIQDTSTCFKRTFGLLQKFQEVSLYIFCLFMKRCMCTCTRLVNVSVLANTGLLAPCTSTKNQVATIAGHTSAPEDPLRQMHGFFFSQRRIRQVSKRIDGHHLFAWVGCHERACPP